MSTRGARTWTLIGRDGRPCESDAPGTLGGHRRSRIYGRLDCASAARAIGRGGYLADRVFFTDEATALAAGYRPCVVCMPARYWAWKAEAQVTAPRWDDPKGATLPGVRRLDGGGGGGQRVRRSYRIVSVVLLTSLLALVVAAGRVAANVTHSRDCGFVSIPKVNDGGAMELVIHGPRHLPTCRRARRQVHAVPRRLPIRTPGRVHGWRCRWSRYWVSCKRGRADIEVYNGGD